MDQVVIGARSFETAWLGKKVVHLGDFCDFSTFFMIRVKKTIEQSRVIGLPAVISLIL